MPKSTSPVRQAVLARFLDEILTFPQYASVHPLDTAGWLALYATRLSEKSHQITAALALADGLEPLLDPAATLSLPEVVRQLQGASSGAGEADSAKAQAEADRVERWAEFQRRYRLTPEHALELGWDPADPLLADLVDAPGDGGQQ